MSGKRKRLVSASTVLLFCVLLLQPETASVAVNESMRTFVTKLVPVLFPYMVLSHFFVTYRLLDPMGKWFGLGGDTGTIFFLGHLCGYPMGAKMTREMVKQGRVSKEKAAMLCAFSSGASPAFLLHGVGSGLWNSGKYGVFLLVTQFLISLVSTWIWKKMADTQHIPQRELQEEISFTTCFCQAIGSSTQQTLCIGGYIVFFTLLVALLTPLLPFSEKLAPILSAVLEFSTGTRLAAGSGGYLGLFCTGFAVGFGGLSVLAQTAHLLEGTGISLRPYVLWKCNMGFVLGLLSMSWGIFEPALLQTRYAFDAFSGQNSGVWLLSYIFLLVILRYREGTKARL